MSRGRALPVATLAVLAAIAAEASPPRRIASLNLVADEVLVEIVPLDRIVAATTAAEDPLSSNIVGRIPGHIPRFFRAELERLVAARPDLVIVSQYTDADFLELLRRSGLRHYRLEGLESPDGIRKAILGLGRVVGAPEGAERLVAAFDARLAEVARRLEGVPRPRVLYWSNPFTAGADSAIGALIACGGARNVGAELGVSGVAPVGAERIFVADPDAFLLGRMEGIRAVLEAHPLLSRARAVREGRIVELPPARLVAISHHFADACEELARALHPGRFGEGAP